MPPPAPGQPNAPSVWLAVLIGVWVVALVVLPFLVAVLADRIAFR